jgi:hypothetical protein
MTDLVERLRKPLFGTHNVLHLEAADEIDLLEKRVSQLLEISAVEIHKRNAEIERLETLLKAKVTPGYELLADQIEKRDAEIERLRGTCQQGLEKR